MTSAVWLQVRQRASQPLHNKVLTGRTPGSPETKGKPGQRDAGDENAGDAGDETAGDETSLGQSVGSFFGPWGASDGSGSWERGSDGLALGSLLFLAGDARGILMDEPDKTTGRGGGLIPWEKADGTLGPHTVPFIDSQSLPGQRRILQPPQWVGVSPCGLIGLRRGGSHTGPWWGLPPSLGAGAE